MYYPFKRVLLKIINFFINLLDRITETVKREILI